MNIGRVNPNRTLETQGIAGAGSVYYNLLEPALVEEAVKRGEGRLGRGGAFLCSTGQFTGRSPKDKFVVRTAAVENTIWWENNAPMTPEAFARLKADMLAHIKGRELFVQDLYAGADPVHRVDVRMVTELAGTGFSSGICCAAPRRRNWTVSIPSGRSSTCPRSRRTRRSTAAAAIP